VNRTDRLTGIILALQNRRQTAAQLADRFEVSRRTILRDVDALSQIGVPIVALPGAGGGLELADNFWLQPIHLTSAEAAALLLAARSLTAQPDAPLAGPGQSAVEKLRAAIRPGVWEEAERGLGQVRMSPPRHTNRLGHFQVVHDAVTSGRWLRIEYQSLRRAASHVIRPLSLSEVDGFWYCSAVSYETRSERQYRLDRMTTVTPVLTPDDAEEVVREAAIPGSAYDDSSHPEVLVLLTYQGARMAEDLPHLGETIHQADVSTWELRFRCPPGELAYWARTFFGFGPHARVVAPPDLRAMIRDLIRSVAAIYCGGPEDGDVPVSPFSQ
jgi:predicted DNA-binding transcriptional regulator YafY